MIYPVSFLIYCSVIGLKLTSLRKTVLFILWEDRRPLKAYEILEKLSVLKENSTAPSIYRALDYFLHYGVVHKIESIQSYTLCESPDKQLPSEVLMLCSQCNGVKEVYSEDIRTWVQRLAKENQFCLGQAPIELKGVCKSCQK
jgi:Fur family zinc uptake transcriptional regulator